MLGRLQDEEITRARRLEAVDALLPALFEALDVREVFARISEIAKEVLPHDAVGLPLVTEDREHIVPYASIGLSHAVTFDILQIPDYVRIRFTDPWDFELFRDLENENSPLAGPYLQWGFRSVICVPIQLKGQIAGLIVFLSRAPEVYSEDDVPVVRRIAMFVALALAHQRLADEARRADWRSPSCASAGTRPRNAPTRLTPAPPDSSRASVRSPRSSTRAPTIAGSSETRRRGARC